MIEQPTGSRISVDAWARMTDGQQKSAAEQVRVRDMISSCVREPGSGASLSGNDFVLVVDAFEACEEELSAELLSMQFGTTTIRRKGAF